MVVGRVQAEFPKLQSLPPFGFVGQFLLFPIQAAVVEMAEGNSPDLGLQPCMCQGNTWWQKEQSTSL